MKYYKVKLYTWSPEISEVEIDRETEHSVFIKGRREAKETGYTAYFKTFNEAFSKLEGIILDNISNKEESLMKAKNELVNFHAKYKRQ
jgi:hypothetical protein